MPAADGPPSGEGEASSLVTWLRSLGLTVPDTLVPAGRNQRRTVYAIAESPGHRAAWLKDFAPQPWWFPLIHPVAWLRVPDPAAREAAMHTLLARAGLAQPGIAGLRLDPASHERWLLIEDLSPMRPLTAGDAPPLWTALAPVLDAGWVLPDLAPHHVYVSPDDPARIAVIDLHRCWRASRRYAWVRTGGAWLAGVGDAFAALDPRASAGGAPYASGIAREAARLAGRARYRRAREFHLSQRERSSSGSDSDAELG